jgi:hypothetical protein
MRVRACALMMVQQGWVVEEEVSSDCRALQSDPEAT